MIVYSFETWRNGNLKDICCDEEIDNKFYIQFVFL